MNNAPFKAIPQNEEFKISFKLESNLLVDWLLALSKQGSKNACLQILYLLQTLKKTKLSTKKRLSFLNTISNYLQQYINLLDDNCWDASFPLSEAELEYAQLISWNYLVLAENFFIAAENTLDRDDDVFSLYKALCCIGQAQLHIAATYGNPCDGFWSLLYQIFAKAEKQNLLKLEINETNLKGVTVNTTFAQILIFQLCDTRQFHPREMQCIFNFLAKVCDNLVFYKITDLQFQTDILKVSYLTAINTITYSFKHLVDHLTNKLIGRQDLMIIQLEKDSPPINGSHDLSQINSSTRYFYPVIVENAIYQVLETGGLWNGILRAMNTELFTLVAKSLEPGKKRKHNREKENKSLLGVIGFDSIISFLYKTTQKNTPKQTKPVVKPLPSFLTYEDLKKYTDDLTNHTQDLQKTELKLNDRYADFELSQMFRTPESAPANIWQNHKHTLKPPTQKVSLKKITILDSSLKGYSVSWDEDAESKAKIGNIFGLISEDKKRLEIALIRRVAANSTGDFLFGSKLLGIKSEIIYITPVEAGTMDDEGGEWAIFIGSDEKLEQFDSVIYNSSRFKVGDIVYLHRNEGLTLCLLMKELHSAATISHIELKYGNSQ